MRLGIEAVLILAAFGAGFYFKGYLLAKAQAVVDALKK